MTSKRANAVNRAIAEARGWTDIHLQDHWVEDVEGFDNWDVQVETVGTPPGASKPEPLPDYATDMNAAIAAAGELLPGRWQLIHFNSGFRFDWSDNTDKWYDIHPKSNAPADIAAAICEAIVRARQMVVESVTED